MGFTDDCDDKSGNPYLNILDVLKSIGSNFSAHLWRPEGITLFVSVIASFFKITLHVLFVFVCSETWLAMLRAVLNTVLEGPSAHMAVSTFWYDPGGSFTV